MVFSHLRQTLGIVGIRTSRLSYFLNKKFKVPCLAGSEKSESKERREVGRVMYVPVSLISWVIHYVAAWFLQAAQLWRFYANVFTRHVVE